MGRSNRTINGRHTFWTCQCECGTVKDVSTNSLKRGESHSCGCMPRGGNHRDFTGEKRGALTTLRPTGNIFGKSPEYVWRCECGNEVILPVSAVPRVGNRKCPDCDKALSRGLTVDMRQRLKSVSLTMFMIGMNEKANYWKKYGNCSIIPKAVILAKSFMMRFAW